MHQGSKFKPILLRMPPINCAISNGVRGSVHAETTKSKSASGCGGNERAFSYIAHHYSDHDTSYSLNWSTNPCSGSSCLMHISFAV